MPSAPFCEGMAEDLIWCKADENRLSMAFITEPDLRRDMRAAGQTVSEQDCDIILKDSKDDASPCDGVPCVRLQCPRVSGELSSCGV